MDTQVFVRYLEFINELLLTDRLWMVQPLVQVLHVRRVALQLAVFHSRGQRASMHVASDSISQSGPLHSQVSSYDDVAEGCSWPMLQPTIRKQGWPKIEHHGGYGSA